jgi:uncharacterized protein
MNKNLEIPWNSYAIIAELSKRLKDVSPQFGKTVLQKMVYFLQEIYHIDCGYDFSLYSYGPFDSQLLGDLDLVEHFGYVKVVPVQSFVGGYVILPSDSVDSIMNKASGFIDTPVTISAFDDLVEKYGKKNAKELELRATILYVERDQKRNKKSLSKEAVRDIVRGIKPKFSNDEIEKAMEELSENGHISLAA